jgi:cytochrome P450
MTRLPADPEITVVKTVDPQNVQSILARNFQDYSLAHQRKGFLSILGTGIFTTDGQAWKNSRSMLRLNLKGIQNRVEMFEPHITNLCDAIPTDGSTVDLQGLFFDLTLDTATQFLFGESAGSLRFGSGERNEESFVPAFNYCMAKLGNDVRTGRPTWLPDQRFNSYKKIIHRFVDRYVHRALKLSSSGENNVHNKHPAFLHDLVQSTQDPTVLRSEALNILLAGRDTTASLLSNIWHTLSRKPDICQKLRSEVDALGGERPTIQQIKSMKYLRYIINECTWLYRRRL